MRFHAHFRAFQGVSGWFEGFKGVLGSSGSFKGLLGSFEGFQERFMGNISYIT